MHEHNWIRACLIGAIAASLITLAAQAAIPALAQAVPATDSTAQRQAQRQAARQAERQQPAAPAPMSDQDLAATQEQLLQLLRTSPTLTQVVARDPSLLSDQQYVSRNNPQLAQFLAQHPDVARNPDYYLFTHLQSKGGRRDQALERAVWPEMAPQQYQPNNLAMFMHELVPIAAFACFLIAVLWLTRAFLENRRWSRTFKLQSDVHARLIERFGSSQELAAYMETEAGKRFLEASPLALGTDSGMRMPNAVARILTPLQVGIVLALLGIGLLMLPRIGSDTTTLVLGTLALMPGLGFILSAAVTWILARRLGLLPEKANAPEATGTGFGPNDRP